MAKKTSLNKGLEALLGETTPQPTKTSKSKNKPNQESNEILISTIVANQFQPRTEFDEKALLQLSESIKEHGVVQPILVRGLNKGFELIAGERRLRAAKLAGLKNIPAVVVDVSNVQSLEIAILENVQREDLNPIDISMGYQRLKNEFGYTQEEMAKKVGKPRSSIANSLRLLSLSTKAQTELKKGNISEGHAKVLLGLEPTKAESMLNEILKQNLSIRDLEKMLHSKQPLFTKKQSKTRDELNLESALSSKLGSKVIIDDKDGKGRLLIKYYSYDELDGIIEKISL
ncbi:ParB/RepB/Spo0J family partition protein [SAR86 cluster bacterium]|nr:ParB/RepB/Spo0J family partition protein [SAR86 cluster bacterium]